jgi:hypothetical protein
VDLGRIQNSRVLVDDRGWERVLQLHNDIGKNPGRGDREEPWAR